MKYRVWLKVVWKKHGNNYIRDILDGQFARAAYALWKKEKK